MTSPDEYAVAPLNDQVDLSVTQWAEAWPELDVSAMEVFGRIHRVFLLYRKHIDAIFDEQGINSASFGVLAALFRSGSPYRLRVSTLADQTPVSTGGMTQRLDRLENQQLIVRERDAVDRRVVYARLTEIGVVCAQRSAQAHFAHETRMLHLLSPSQRAGLADSLRLLELSVTTAESARAD